jgi:ABC-type antimicrobial peptide transport system permease subunit
VVQVLALALGGVIVAVPLAWLTSKGLQQLPQQVPLAFTTGAFVVTSVAMVVTALIGALLSAWQAVRVDPIIALGQQQ